ncbi:hypothetical protein ONZ45_g3391 [Pleurotus djamor]|nr:hypothetical protein ONZ45_g3391 [Pleurotus djamor]
MPSTILDVPNEILTPIFEYVLDEVPLRPADVNSVGLVCKHWHDVVTSDSRLWRYIDLGSPLWTEVCLKRSKRSKLIVKASLLYEHEAAARIEPLMTETDRIEYLALTFAGPEASRCLQELLMNGFPFLHSLSLADFGLNVGSFSSPFSTPSRFIFKFPGVAHRLTRLELDGISLASFECPAPHVTDLTLRRASFHESCLALVNTLAKLPQLQRLELDYVCPTSKQPPTTCARLSHLSKLVIRDLDPQSCAVLLDAIEFPSVVVPMIVCRGSGITSLAPLSKKCPYISDVTPARLPIRELHVSHGIFDQRYRASLSARAQAIPFTDDLKFYQFDDAPDLPELDEVTGLKPVVMKNVCDRLDLRQLQTLVLHADASFQYVYLPQLQNVTRLSLHGHLAPFLPLLDPQIAPIEASDLGFSSKQRYTSINIPFPNLYAIWIIKDLTNAIAADLAGILGRRETHGYKVRKLVTSAGSTSAGHCRLLESKIEPLSSPSPPHPAPMRLVVSPPPSSVFFSFGIILAMLPQLFASLIALRLNTYDNQACDIYTDDRQALM